MQLGLVDDGGQVEFTFGDLAGGSRSELEYLLLLHGAMPSATGIRLPTLTFRRLSSELATILSRVDGVRIESGVNAILVDQLADVRARRAASAGLGELPVAEVSSQIATAGRFIRRLTDEQLTNLGRLLVLRHGANFSVPGAGKTATLLAVFEAGRTAERVDRLVVVAPKNAFVSWEQEIAESFDPDALPSTRRLTGGRRGVAAALADDPEVVLITYQLLPNVLDLVRAWGRHHGCHVVLDESHRVKGGLAGLHASSALALAEIAARRDILSGTPMPHSPEDLRSQFEFLWPGQRILPDGRLAAEDAGVITGIERTVRPLYVRTTKDMLDLPAIAVQPVGVPLGPLQRELYDVLRSEAARVAAGMGPRDRRFFRLLGRHVIRLIQAASNPMLLTQGELVDPVSRAAPPQGVRAWELLREFARYESPAKVEQAVVRAEAAIASGERVVIWSAFVNNVRAVERLLEAHGAVSIYGDVATGSEDDPDTREFRIRRFHEDPTCRVMIANPAAAGEGISLHRASHYAIYLDRTFNAAHYLQSIDRIHRLGSTEPARVDVLEAEGTVDQRIARRLLSKIDAMARILNDEGLYALAYDPADVVEEVEGGIDAGDVDEIVDHLLQGRPDS